MADEVNWTATRAQEFGLPPQGEDESDAAFRYRISSSLRDMGHIIEAHEAYQNALFDTSDAVVTGILGGVTQEFKQDYGKNDGSRVGDDIATGILVKNPQEPNPWAVLLAAFLR